MKELQKAAFGMGCFWSPDKLFSDTPGAENVVVGYMGGETKDPTYEQVCTGDTGHAETVYIEFDPEKISYNELLDLFWNNHNPTQGDRQGPDSGSQYRSMIFYYTDEQKNLAEESRSKLEESGRFGDSITTKIAPASEFYKAEEYHQKYLEKTGRSVCH